VTFSWAHTIIPYEKIKEGAWIMANGTDEIYGFGESRDDTKVDFDNGGFVEYSQAVENKEKKLKQKIKKFKKRAKKKGYLAYEDEIKLAKLKKKMRKLKKQQKKQQRRLTVDEYNHQSQMLEMKRKNAILSLILLSHTPNQEKIRDRLVEEALVNGVLSYQPLPVADIEVIDNI
jgi:helix-turn-helix protein